MARPRKPVDAPDLASRKAKLDAEREELDAAIKARVEVLKTEIVARHEEYTRLTGDAAFFFIGTPSLVDQFCELRDRLFPPSSVIASSSVKLTSVHVGPESSVTIRPTPSVPIARVVPVNPGTKDETQTLAKGCLVCADGAYVGKCPACHRSIPPAAPGLDLPAFLDRAKRGEAGEG